MRRSFCAGLVVLLLASCATWEFGPPKTLTDNAQAPDTELALLAIHGEMDTADGGFMLTRLESLDANAFVSALPDNFWTPANVNAVPYYRLSPGRYRLHFRADRFRGGPGLMTSMHANNVVEVELAPGHKYLPMLATNGSQYRIRVADEGTSFRPECFPYYRTALMARAVLHGDKAGDYAAHVKQYACRW